MLTNMTDTTAPDHSDATFPEKPKRRLGLWVGVGVALAAVVAAGIAIPVSISNAQAAEKAAAEEAAAEAELERLASFSSALNGCQSSGSESIEVLDAGEAVSFARVGKLNGPTVAELYCVLSDLGAPATLEAKIGATRALDGVQTDEWSGYEIEWRYHPDDGATVLIEHAH